MEAEAVLAILAIVESGRVELLSSEALRFEIGRIPDAERQVKALDILELARQTIEVGDEIETQAADLVKSGIRPMDALHLATAAWTKADFFCTCDDKLLKKSKQLKGLSVRVVSPLELIAEVTP